MCSFSICQTFLFAKDRFFLSFPTQKLGKSYNLMKIVLKYQTYVDVPIYPFV